MNVIVYSGPEVLPLSLNNVIASLRALLLPHYTVQPISQPALLAQPWKSSCALLVVPQIRNPQHGFVSPASRHIKDFVESGGKCLMFGTRARIKPRTAFGLGAAFGGLTIGLEGEQEPLALPLKFFDNANNCYVTFDMDNEGLETREHEEQLRLVTLDPTTGTAFKVLCNTGSGHLLGFEGLKGTSVLAHCSKEENGRSKSIACLNMMINRGTLALLGPNLEHPLTQESIYALPSSDIQSFDAARISLLRTTFQELGLHLPDDHLPPPLWQPHPQFLTCTPGLPSIVSNIVDAISGSESASVIQGELKGFRDVNDEFRFRPFHTQDGLQLLHPATLKTDSRSTEDTSHRQPRDIIVCKDGVLPDPNMTPLFDIKDYYETLSGARETQSLVSGADGSTWGMGEALLYGEVVTSTQTMLDKNPALLSSLPIPLLSLASHQLAGRGRGTNLWLSPPGCLQFSLLLRVSLSSSLLMPAFPATKLVFVQYLFALAVVEACRDDKVLGRTAGSRVRIKWPNDLYADVGLDGKEDFRKVGGILVNTSFQGGKVEIVIGCGLNVLNEPPITSLVQLHQIQSCLSQTAASAPSMERTAAVIMAKFESLWRIFIHERSFEPFMNSYLKYWLHSDQVVTLTTTNPHLKVRIVGITADHGLLRTLPERGSGFDSSRVHSPTTFIDLQPDGNSFDLMAGLIKSKT